MSALWGQYCAFTSLGEYVEGARVEFYQETITTGDALDPENGDPEQDFGIYVVLCHGVNGEFLQWDPVIWPLTPPVDPTSVRDDVVARISPPTPAVGSSPSIDSAPSVVGLETWLWIDDPWQAIVESETRGAVAVDVAATPVEVRWDFGAGGSQTCNNPGERWTPERDGGGTPCGLTFAHSSAGQVDDRYTGTVTVIWQTRWWLNGVDQGSFGTIDRSAPLAVEVAEIQALETS